MRRLISNPLNTLACACAALICSVAPDLADEAAPSPLPEPPVSMQAYGAHNPDCLEWTDSCVVCRRLDAPQKDAAGHDATDIACSTPGIACQANTINCASSAK
jgi:hypothetical protein